MRAVTLIEKLKIQIRNWKTVQQTEKNNNSKNWMTKIVNVSKSTLLKISSNQQQQIYRQFSCVKSFQLLIDVIFRLLWKADRHLLPTLVRNSFISILVSLTTVTLFPCLFCANTNWLYSKLRTKYCHFERNSPGLGKNRSTPITAEIFITKTIEHISMYIIGRMKRKIGNECEGKRVRKL